ncbi:hypothetical protein LCGC14_1633710, partial [marine sediment metagenome]
LAESDKVSEKPDCDGGCSSCESHACDIDETAKDVTDGPISESAPTAEEVSKADLEVFLNENPITGDVEDVEDLKMTGGDVEESDAE